jgi:plasmid rolling circle replication initiator protein Rep
LNKLLLGQVYACEVRNCPICSWKRNEEWIARGQEAIKCVMAENPKLKIIFLDLSCAAIKLSSLKAQIKYFKESFHRLSQAKALQKAEGYIKYLRVVKLSETEVELHLQCFLFVKAGFYGGESYLSNKKWIELWA